MAGYECSLRYQMRELESWPSDMHFDDNETEAKRHDYTKLAQPEQVRRSLCGNSWSRLPRTTFASEDET